MPRKGQRDRKDITPAELTQAVSRLTGDPDSGGAFIERLADQLGVSPRELHHYLESFGQEKRARGALDRELIVEVALRVADEHGLEALTLRRLAAELGVTPTALYRYVESKDALLDAMADYVLGRVNVGEAPDMTWQETLRALALSARDAFAPYPAAALLGTTRPIALGDNALRLRDAGIGAFRRAGLRPGEALELFDLFVNLCLALILRETSPALGPGYMDEPREERLRRLRRDVETLSPGKYPWAAEAIELWTSPPDPLREFGRGLEVVMSGLEADVEALLRFRE
jgi:AcrR family transcriptional regulator